MEYWPVREKIECVYIIEAVGLDRIKVGFTSDLVKRLRTIQTSCPAPVLLIAVIRGGRETERDIHRTLRPYRAYGEWFNCDHEIATQFKAMNDDELMREIKMEWAFRGKDMLDILSNLFAEMCE
jgi:hypothetical protein